MWADTPQLSRHRVETSAMLAVIAELAADDDVLAARIRRELAEQRERLPEWLDGLRDARRCTRPRRWSTCSAMATTSTLR